MGYFENIFGEDPGGKRVRGKCLNCGKNYQWRVPKDGPSGGGCLSGKHFLENSHHFMICKVKSRTCPCGEKINTIFFKNLKGQKRECWGGYRYCPK